MCLQLTSRGIDISHHQGNVDWTLLKRQHGLTWGACKATEGSTFTDDRFARNWSALHAVGLVRMAYHFARPETSSGAFQARRFLAVVKPVKGDVLCLDLEESDLDQAPTNLWAREFASVLRALAPDCTTVLYAGGNADHRTGYVFSGTARGLAAHFDYWWYPRYTGIKSWPAVVIPVAGNTTGWPAPHIWQWSAQLTPGYDANVSTLTAAQLSAGPATTEDDMPTVNELWTAQLPREPGQKTESAQAQLYKANINSYRANNTLAALTTQVTALTAAVKVLAATSGANADQIEATVKAAAEAALADLKITLVTDPEGS